MLRNRYISEVEAEIEKKSCPQWAAEAEAQQPGQSGKFTFEILERYGTFDDAGEWIGEVTKTSWNGREPKLDIRYWKRDGSRSRKAGNVVNGCGQKASAPY